MVIQGGIIRLPGRLLGGSADARSGFSLHISQPRAFIATGSGSVPTLFLPGDSGPSGVIRGNWPSVASAEYR